MEHFEITKTPEGFHIEGFPDAVKVIRIDGRKARKLADLALHKADLNFALECLEEINRAPEQPHVLRQALWRAAVVHFIKCFGASKARFSLDARTVYKGDAGAMEPYWYFDSLRNKHLVHDENSYAQCLPGAVLNRKDIGPKIAKIVCVSVAGDTLEQANYNNLHLLTCRAREWVVAQFDALCNVLTSELESEPYEVLIERQGMKYSVPGPDDVHRQRNAL
ncbi:MAG: hypothetical protein V3R83_01520 [Gammaproteobacteria bacterium]